MTGGARFLALLCKSFTENWAKFMWNIGLHTSKAHPLASRPLCFGVVSVAHVLVGDRGPKR